MKRSGIELPPGYRWIEVGEELKSSDLIFVFSSNDWIEFGVGGLPMNNPGGPCIRPDPAYKKPEREWLNTWE